MNAASPDFSVDVAGVEGTCPVGERYAAEHLAKGTFPVLSCEGPCIRGEIARLAANHVANEVPGLARACHGEAFFVPHSGMAQWVRTARKTVVVDGCFLRCHGRVLDKMIAPEKVIRFEALPFYKKYTDVFLMDDVAEEERRAVAREVADRIIEKLRSP